MSERVEVSRLRGLQVLFEDDLYELAMFLLKVHMAQDTPTQTTRTTVHGLVAAYARLVTVNGDRARAMLEASGLSLGACIVPVGQAETP